MFFYDRPNKKFGYIVDKIINLSYGQDFLNVPLTTILTDRSKTNHPFGCYGFNGTPTNGSDGLGAIALNGASGLGYTSGPPIASSQMTFEVRISNWQLNATQGNYVLEQSIHYNNTPAENCVAYYGPTGKFIIGYAWYTGTNYIENTTLLSFDFSGNTKNTLTFTWNTNAVSNIDVIKIYVNGVRQKAPTTHDDATRGGTIASHTMYWFSRALNQSFLTGKVYNMRLYGKELNQAEITQNFMYDKRLYY